MELNVNIANTLAVLIGSALVIVGDHGVQQVVLQSSDD
jgi:hypothetical protein